MPKAGIHQGKGRSLKNFVPQDHGWEILPGEDQLPARLQGEFNLNFKNLELYLSDHQKQSREGGNILRSIDGNALYLDLNLKKKPVLLAIVLDFFLNNQDRIPDTLPKYDDEGEVLYVCFWGSIYGTSERNKGIRCMYWDKTIKEWRGDRRFFGEDFHKNYPALCMSLK